MTIKEFYDQVASNEDVKKKVAELTKSGKSLDDAWRCPQPKPCAYRCQSRCSEVLRL